MPFPVGCRLLLPPSVRSRPAVLSGSSAYVGSCLKWEEAEWMRALTPGANKVRLAQLAPILLLDRPMAPVWSHIKSHVTRKWGYA